MKAVIFLTFATVIGLTIVSCEDSSQPRRISTGYSSDKDYTPTMDSRGGYHNEGTGDRQVQYQGSSEQQSDLDAIDRYAAEHPDF